MDRQEAAAALAEGRVTFMKPEDKFSFGCNMCGGCCKNRDDILLTPYDLYNIAKAKNMTTEEVINKYCNIYQGSDSKLPIVQVKYKQAYGYTVCPFLKKTCSYSVCEVHHRKPFVCAAFPLGRASSYNIETGEVESGYYFNGGCDHHNSTEHTLQEWMDNFKIDKGEEPAKIHHKTLLEISGKYDLKKFYSNTTVTDKTKEMFLNGMAGILYIGLEEANDDNITEFLRDRANTLLNIVDKMMEFGESIGLNFKRKR